MRDKVAAVFGQGFTAPAPHLSQVTPDSKELAADFDSPATMKAVWGTGTAVGLKRPMNCGIAKYDGVAIGAVRASGSTATVPVTLYEGAKAGAAEITVTVDPASGVIKGLKCGGAPEAADFPGIAPIAAYYGATASLNQSVLNDKTKSYFTPAFAAWSPVAMNYNALTCTQDVPDSWIVALTGTTSASSAWNFEPGPVTTLADPANPSGTSGTGFTASMAVDLGSAKISRITCQANPPVADPAQPGQYAANLLDYYRRAAEQASLGVDPKAAIQPYFVSDAAFTAAWGNSGAVPLLCAKTLPGSVQQTEDTTPTTSGSQTTVSMATWPDWHPGNPGQELSTFTVTLDTKTLKISSVTCAK
ncbi:hypothetical protein [Catenulispora acidiphila]|nr:hypothetical protein [Catenulispora acidiphila]